jgi:hypothetical protein
VGGEADIESGKERRRLGGGLGEERIGEGWFGVVTTSGLEAVQGTCTWMRRGEGDTGGTR